MCFSRAASRCLQPVMKSTIGYRAAGTSGRFVLDDNNMMASIMEIND